MAMRRLRTVHRDPHREWDATGNVVLHRELTRRSTRRSRGDGRRHVGDLLQHDVAATLDDRDYIIRW